MKVAILGSGGMGELVIEHLKSCALVSGITAYDRRAERLRELSKRFGVNTTDQLQAVLSDPSIRLVFVTASNDAHKDLTIAALEAGKAVMCEKPMATNLEDAQAMVRAAERTGGFLQIGFELRYSKLYVAVKDWIDQGLLGTVVNTNCYYSSSSYAKQNQWRCRTASTGGMFGEKLSHYVDLTRWWIGSEVEEVHSMCAPNIIPYMEIHDNFHTTYRFASGAISHLTFVMGVAATFDGDPLQNMVSQQQADGHALRYLIVGTKGAAATDVFGRTLKRWQFAQTELKLTSTLVETRTWRADEDHFYFHNTFDQTQDIVRRVKEGLTPKTSAADALNSMKLCFAAEQSASVLRPIQLNLRPNAGSINEKTQSRTVIDNQQNARPKNRGKERVAPTAALALSKE